MSTGADNHAADRLERTVMIREGFVPITCRVFTHGICQHLCDVENERVRSPPVNYNYVISLLVCAVRFCELRPRAAGREDLRQRDMGDDKVGKNIDSSSPLFFTLFSRMVFYTPARATLT